MQIVSLATKRRAESILLVLKLLLSDVGCASHEVSIVDQLFLAKLLQPVDCTFTDLGAERETQEAESMVSENR